MPSAAASPGRSATPSSSTSPWSASPQQSQGPRHNSNGSPAASRPPSSPGTSASTSTITEVDLTNLRLAARHIDSQMPEHLQDREPLFALPPFRICDVMRRRGLAKTAHIMLGATDGRRFRIGFKVYTPKSFRNDKTSYTRGVVGWIEVAPDLTLVLRRHDFPQAEAEALAEQQLPGGASAREFVMVNTGGPVNDSTPLFAVVSDIPMELQVYATPAADSAAPSPLGIELLGAAVVREGEVAIYGLSEDDPDEPISTTRLAGAPSPPSGGAAAPQARSHRSAAHLRSLLPRDLAGDDLDSLDGAEDSDGSIISGGHRLRRRRAAGGRDRSASESSEQASDSTRPPRSQNPQHRPPSGLPPQPAILVPPSQLHRPARPKTTARKRTQAAREDSESESPDDSDEERPLQQPSMAKRPRVAASPQLPKLTIPRSPRASAARLVADPSALAASLASSTSASASRGPARGARRSRRRHRMPAFPGAPEDRFRQAAAHAVDDDGSVLSLPGLEGDSDSEYERPFMGYGSEEEEDEGDISDSEAEGCPLLPSAACPAAAAAAPAQVLASRAPGAAVPACLPQAQPPLQTRPPTHPQPQPHLVPLALPQQQQQPQQPQPQPQLQAPPGLPALPGEEQQTLVWDRQYFLPPPPGAGPRLRSAFNLQAQPSGPAPPQPACCPEGGPHRAPHHSHPPGHPHQHSLYLQRGGSFSMRSPTAAAGTAGAFAAGRAPSFDPEVFLIPNGSEAATGGSGPALQYTPVSSFSQPMLPPPLPVPPGPHQLVLPPMPMVVPPGLAYAGYPLGASLTPQIITPRAVTPRAAAAMGYHLR